MASPDWSNLHADILLPILGRLRVKDYVRFGAVCVPWNRLAASNLVPPAPQVPWLMLSTRESYHLPTAMYDPLTNKQKCRIRLENHRFFGSTSDGYLIFHSHKNILLLNPLTKSCITLLSLIALPRRHGYLSEIRHTHFLKIRSVAVHVRPSTIAAICYKNFDTDSLAFCKAGDDAWTYLGESPKLSHIIFYKDQLYGVTNDTGALCSFDLRENSICSILTHDNVKDLSYKYLVESTGGDLLKVHRSKGDMVNAVFKLEPSSNTWRIVRSIGDDAIMLSFQGKDSTRSMCISTQNLPDLRPNCVYSISSYQLPRPVYNIGDGVYSISSYQLPMTVYNIGDGSTEEMYLPLGNESFYNIHIRNWFTPSLS